MKSVRRGRRWLCLLTLAVVTGVQPLTFDVKAVKLSANQEASLKRFLADSLPALTFDWKSLEVYSTASGGRRQPLSATLGTMPALMAAGICRSEQHRFYLEAAAGKREGRWQSNDDLTSFQAWIPHGGDCAQKSSTIHVDKSLSDTDFLFIEQQRARCVAGRRASSAGAIAPESGFAR